MSNSQSAAFMPVRTERRSHATAAFVIESLLLLIFVMLSVAIVANLLGGAYKEGVKAQRISNATLAATNEAERFSANPSGTSIEVIYVQTDQGMQRVQTKKSDTSDSVEFEGRTIFFNEPIVYIVQRDVAKEALESGEIYDAEFTVLCQGEAVASINTSKYVSSNIIKDDDAEAGYGSDTTDTSDTYDVGGVA